MKLDRYMIRELVVPFLIGTIAVVLMFQANLLIFIFKTYSISNIPLAAILKLVLYKTPFFLNMTLPVGIALATSLAMSRIVRESELTAMRAAGASILRVLFPISIFGLLVGVANFYVAESVMPRTEREATKLNGQLIALGAAPDFASHVTRRIDNYTAQIGNVYREGSGRLQLNDIRLDYEVSPGDWESYIAPSGTYDSGIWTFPNAIYFHTQGSNLASFASKTLTISDRININDLYSQPEPTEQSLSDLKKTIAEAKQQRQDTASLEVVYQERFSVPAACYVFAIVGPVFAIWFGRGGGFAGVLLSILMVLIYWNVYIISTEILGRLSWVSPVVAAWLPNALFLAAAILAIRRLE